MNDPAGDSIFMRKAIALARRGVDSGDGGPFGCVIVRAGQIVGEGWNRVVATNDPTAHGEIGAIRDACARSKSFVLRDCELFTTGEPCPMCLGAILWARIPRVVYAFSISDAAEIGFDDRTMFAQIAGPPDQRPVQLTGGDAEVRREALEIAQQWFRRPDRVRY